MTPIRLGAVGFLNARPLVYGLDRSRRFDVRFDVPSRTAALLHDGVVDVGLIPSIECLRAPVPGGYAIVPGLAIASRGPVASVALYTRTPVNAVRSVVLDTSSRTSVALLKVLCARRFHIAPTFADHAPDLGRMLAAADAALLIGDAALILDEEAASRLVGADVRKIDLGAAWTELTGLPFVYAVWAGRPGVLTSEDVGHLQRARDEGVARSADLAAEYFAAQPEHRLRGARYLRENIKYDLGPDERAGLERFHREAVAVGAADAVQPLQFFEDAPLAAARPAADVRRP